MYPRHFTAETALDFLEERLDEGQTLVWREHVKECTRCARYLVEWEHLLAVLKRTKLKSAPEPHMKRVIGIFPHQSEELRTSIRCIVATAVHDTFSRPFPAGARGGASATTRGLVLQAEDFDIHVQISGEPEQRQILGQILSRNREDFAIIARLHLLRNGKRLQAVATDTLGEFHFADVPEGELSLQVDLPHLTIVGALNLK
jgi:hypothetical protein